MKKQQRILLLALTVSGCFAIADSAAQEVQRITGKVTDAHREAVIGASVAIAGSTLGTVTDLEGGFELSAPVGSTLTVSYIGYAVYQEKITAAKTRYPVTLQEAAEALDEVVVVGYGTQRRSELTGAISSVRAKDVRDFSTRSLAESLSGLAAGVMITKGDGDPGGAAEILIRGAGSVNGMSPLFIVDGVAQDAGFKFNMRDVESIEILKDAGSAAIYGSRAAGGVVLITTRHGRRGEKATIQANARYGMRNITSHIQLLNTTDWIRAHDAFGTGNTLDLLGATRPEDLPNTNWMDVLFDTGIEQEYGLSVTAASDKVTFFLSGGFLSEKGVYLDTKAERFSFRNNLEYQFNKHITLGESFYGNTTKTNPSTQSSIYNHTIPFRTVPVAPVYDENGNYAPTPQKAGSGPNFAGLEDLYHVFNDHNYTLNAQAYLHILFVKGLELKVTGAGEWTGFSKNTFTEYRNFGPVEVKPQRLDASAGTLQNLMFNAVLTGEKTLGNHSLKAMVGTEFWKKDGYNLSVTGYEFSIPVAESLALASPGNTKDATDNLPIERRESFFGRINYNYLGKYLLTANIRADASDRFVGKNRWGYFPSLNAGWRISEEDFLKPYIENRIDNAKIRASWGRLGNDAIPQFMYESTYSGMGISHSFDGTSASQAGYWIATFGNRSIKWEEIDQTDLGVDLSFLRNRLTLTYDYYNRQTKDMLYPASLSLSSGMSYYFNSDRPGNTLSYFANAGLVENKGHEITVGWADRKQAFRYSVGANASFNANRVRRIGADISSIDEGLNDSWRLLARTENGMPMAMFYGYGVLGIFQNQAQVDEYNQRALDAWRAQNPNHTRFDPATGQPLDFEGNVLGIYYQKEQTGVGDLIFDDNGQGRVTALSRKYIGNPWPKMTLGLNLNLEYRGFDLSAVFQGAFGFDMMNLIKPYTQMFSSDNTTADIFKTSCFGKDNTAVTGFPRVGYLDAKGSFIGDGAANRNYSTVSGYLLEKGDYLKLKNLVIGYTLPKTVVRKAALENVRIYISAQNVFTLTRYSGIDPETGGGVLLRGVDHQNRYLPSRLISFGIDLSF
ncbi:MAG: TonB-dependent receptor [Dysgonamonadaceae bacterium]|jgi:TonB-linked SusC/RagA family outer membrane protein|nr:TonB-dependent receptor [Dysgonamonadaceae bacterium]